MKRWALLLMLPAAALMSCSKPASEVRVSQADVLPPTVRQAAAERGQAIAAETFSLLSSNLQSAIQSAGVSNALPYCSLLASPLTAGVATKHDVALRRITLKPRNPAAAPDAAERRVLIAFEVAVAGNSASPPEPIVTNLAPESVTFFAPIVLNHDLCLKCHGEPGKDIAPENLAEIQRLYPQDRATGFRQGDLRGAWRIDFPRTAFESAATLNTR